MSRTIILIVITICVSLWYMIDHYYTHILTTYFRKDDMIIYDFYLKHFIQVVSKDNTFMNYGLWDVDHTDLQSANENLTKHIFSKANTDKKDLKILDVGCGYGNQDANWAELLDPSALITAIDISQIQIEYARQKYSAIKNINFQQGDALKIQEQFAKNSFDIVFSLESAFHYTDRKKFFTNVENTLKQGGQFIISDIVLNNSYKPTIISRIFTKFYSDFLSMPDINFITFDKWKQNISDTGLDIIECTDITQQTFIPYYNYFFYTYIKNKNMPKAIAWILDTMFYTVQPFSYVVAVCTKPDHTTPDHTTPVQSEHDHLVQLEP